MRLCRYYCERNEFLEDKLEEAYAKAEAENQTI
jgi:hypothetical protein